MQQDKVRNWLWQHAWPLWQSNGIDPKNGGFRENLGPDAQPVDTSRKRLRTQCRQLYVFATACRHGWQREECEKLLHRAWGFMVSRYRRADGGWIFSVTDDGAVLDQRTDFYELAFVIFASAQYYDVSRDSTALDAARGAIDWLNTHLRDKIHGGWQNGLDAAGLVHDQAREQNPHMHLFEALLTLMKVHPEAVPDWMLQELLWLAESKFVDDQGHLHEFFTADWQLAAGAAGAQVEPGHLYEWVWILQRAATFLEPARCQALAKRLYEAANCIGEALTHRVHDGLVSDRMPITDDEKLSHRLWPQTEVIKAHLAMARFGDRQARARADAAMTLLFKHYLEPVTTSGLWFEHLSDDARVQRVDSPATSFYHLVMAMDDWLD